MHTSPLINILKPVWTRSPYPMLVDHRSHPQGRICPAPTLYLGARRWARLYFDQGIRPGDAVPVIAKASAEVLMRTLGLLRIGAAAVLGSQDHPTTLGDFRGLVFDADRRIDEATMVAALSRPCSRPPPAWWNLGPWSDRETWLYEILPALGQGAELHVNVRCLNEADLFDHWPDVVGAVRAGAARPLDFVGVEATDAGLPLSTHPPSSDHHAGGKNRDSARSIESARGPHTS